MTTSVYEIYQNSLGNDVLKRTDANGKVWFIPIDPANSDYQIYLESLNETKTK